MLRPIVKILAPLWEVHILAKNETEICEFLSFIFGFGDLQNNLQTKTLNLIAQHNLEVLIPLNFICFTVRALLLPQF